MQPAGGQLSSGIRMQAMVIALMSVDVDSTATSTHSYL